jgi:hypothetical protein
MKAPFFYNNHRRFILFQGFVILKVKDNAKSLSQCLQLMSVDLSTVPPNWVSVGSFHSIVASHSDLGNVDDEQCGSPSHRG